MDRLSDIQLMVVFVSSMNSGNMEMAETAFKIIKRREENIYSGNALSFDNFQNRHSLSEEEGNFIKKISSDHTY